MALRPLTDDERARAREKATAARSVRAEIKKGLRDGTVSVAEVLRRGDEDEAVSRLKVTELLESTPGSAGSGPPRSWSRSALPPPAACAGWASTSAARWWSTWTAEEPPRGRWLPVGTVTDEFDPTVTAPPEVFVPASPTVTVLAGPTAVGKGTVSTYVRDHYPDVWLSVSATTRAPARARWTACTTSSSATPSSTA